MKEVRVKIPNQPAKPPQGLQIQTPCPGQGLAWNIRLPKDFSVRADFAQDQHARIKLIARQSSSKERELLGGPGKMQLGNYEENLHGFRHPYL